MSMELLIFSDFQLKSIAEWQAAIDAEGYPLRLLDDISFANLRGFLPAQLRGKATGFECYHDNASELIREHPDITFDHLWKCALGLRWVGSKLEELRAAWMAATAYAKATDGMIFDDQEAKFRNAIEARQVVCDVERDLPNTDWIVEKVLRGLKLGPYSKGN